MHESMLELLRCPFCGGRLSPVRNDALVGAGARIESGVLGCECCAFPVVEGIPVLIADETTRGALHALEAGRREAAFFMLLGLDEAGAESFRALLVRGREATYRDALAVLCQDAEGAYFAYRLSDPTYVVAEALLMAIGRQQWTMAGRALDVCGGSGHLTRVLEGLRPAGGTVLADIFFWKLWLATRFVSPGCEPVCCDANSPLPFTRDAFSPVLLADAFPYIWHKRLLVEEMKRLSGPDGVIAMPHLHSALGENFSAGDTLTPEAYRDLFAPEEPRLFSDQTLLGNVLDRGLVDLTADVSPAELGDEPSFTLVASRRTELFQTYAVPATRDVTGALQVNPLYHVERRGDQSVLSLRFPTREYAEEFSECRRYLPDTLTIAADLSGSIVPETLGSEYEELRRRRIVIDAPLGY